MNNLMEIIKEITNNTYTIYCDMDGVLTDFDKLYSKYSNNISPSVYRNTYGRDKFWALIEPLGEKFWSSLEWMSGGKNLWSYIKSNDPVILSSFPKIKSKDKVIKGKIKWINKNLHTSNYTFTTKQEKKSHSAKNRILIDDNSNTIKEWKSKGGIGILHKSASDTINKLKKLGL